METTKFKTTIKCSGCVAKVKPFLDEALDGKSWDVDYNNPSKILTVKGESDPDKIITALQKAGYKADLIQE
jgi:copper chaperone